MFTRAVLLFLALIAVPAMAHDYKTGELEIIHPWGRTTSDEAHNGAAYMTIVNHGSADDRLLSASADIADSISLHDMDVTGVIMVMHELPGGIELPAGQTVRIMPNSLHLMLTGLHKPLKAGMKIPMTLTFAKAGELPIEVIVQAQDEPLPASMDGMKMGTMSASPKQ